MWLIILGVVAVVSYVAGRGKGRRDGRDAASWERDYRDAYRQKREEGGREDGERKGSS